MATAKKKPKSVALSAATQETPTAIIAQRIDTLWRGLTATQAASWVNMRLSAIAMEAGRFHYATQRGEIDQAQDAARTMLEEIRHLEQESLHLTSLLTLATKMQLCEANENRTISVGGTEYLSYTEAVLSLCRGVCIIASAYDNAMSAANEISERILRNVTSLNVISLKNALICEDRRLRAVQNKNKTTLPPLTDSQQEVFDFIREHGPVLGKQICTGLGISSESTLTRHYIRPLKLHGVKNRRGSGYYLDK